ncbi:MAG TPA: DUF3313 family protein [Candidatus Acidoferrum sp.]|nr:DUF3313 family protein [Candidatus Acidoferrum sp.]
MCKASKLLLSVTALLVAGLWAGCKTSAPAPSGFLSDYSRLRQVNDSTWRYVDTVQLAKYKSFMIPPVKVMVREYWGTTFTPDQQERVGAVFRQKIMNALTPPYEVVASPGPGTAEVRVALTQAYRVGNALAMGVEAEIVDPASHQQLAAIRGVRIGPPEAGFRMGAMNTTGVGGDYMASWWNLPSAMQLMEEWASQMRKLVDEGHGN